MVASLKSVLRGRLATLVWLLCFAGSLAGLARAEMLIDPTRSPLGAHGAGSGAAVANEAAPAATATRLQMIVRGPGEARSALIDGNTVRVGDTVSFAGGPARVERITDSTVVLARGEKRETLQLIPGADQSVKCARRDGSQRPGGC
jgi:hypothetical protein